MSYSISVDISVVPKLPREIGIGRWARHNENKRWKAIIYRTFIGIAPKYPLQKSKITVTRFTAQQPDEDNLYASLKSVLDALTKHRIIEDDGPQFIELEAKWEYTQQRKGFLKIEIIELQGGVNEASGENR